MKREAEYFLRAALALPFSLQNIPFFLFFFSLFIPCATRPHLFQFLFSLFSFFFHFFPLAPTAAGNEMEKEGKKVEKDGERDK